MATKQLKLIGKSEARKSKEELIAERPDWITPKDWDELDRETQGAINTAIKSGREQEARDLLAEANEEDDSNSDDAKPVDSKDIAISGSMGMFADELGKSIAEDERLCAAINTFVLAKSTLDYAVLTWLPHLERIFPDKNQNGDRTNNGMSTWPWPRTPQFVKDKQGKEQATNTLYDTWIKDGKTFSFYSIQLERTPWGKALRNAHTQYKLAKEKGGGHPPPEFNVVRLPNGLTIRFSEVKDMLVQGAAAQSHLNMLNSLRTSCVATLRNCAGVHLMKLRVQENVPHVAVRYSEAPIHDAMGNEKGTRLIKASRAIELFANDPNNLRTMGASDAMSARRFQSLRPEAVIGGSLKDLLGTLPKRKPKGTAVPAKVEAPSIGKQLEHALRCLNMGFDQDATDAGSAWVDLLIKRVGDKTGQGILLELGWLTQQLNTFMQRGNPNMLHKFAKLNEEYSATPEAERDAKFFKQD